MHLHLPPELDLPLPATTQIYFQPPSSYLIPRAWDLGLERGAFTRIEFPGIGKGGSQDDVDTFETIIAQCTAFLERAPPPKPPRPSKSRSKSSRSLEDELIPAYNPSAFKPGEGYVRGSSSGSSTARGQIVLVDEENGSVVGELGEGFHVVEDSKMKPGSKDPVVITLPEDGSQEIGVEPATAKHIEKAIHPAYKNSTLVTKAAAASRLIIASSEYVSKTLHAQADHFTQTTKPNPKPMTFTPTTHERVRKVHTFSSGAAGMSSKVVGHVSKYAQSIGATLLKHTNQGVGSDGKPKEDFEPGLLNKSMMAFSTIADGVDHAGRNLLTSSTSAATKVVTYRYGEEAGDISRSIGGNIKNVALVYIDVTGVSRKAIVKSVAKGMIVGRIGDGKHLIVPGTEEEVESTSPTSSQLAPGVVPTVGRVPSALDKRSPTKPKNRKEKEATEGWNTDDASMMSGGKRSPTGVAEASQQFPPPPPIYGSGIGQIIDETQYTGDSKDTWR